MELILPSESKSIPELSDIICNAPYTPLSNRYCPVLRGEVYKMLIKVWWVGVWFGVTLIEIIVKVKIKKKEV
jgi:hypothetical protein